MILTKYLLFASLQGTMLQLQAHKREIFGKQLEKLRAEGKIPAQVYGHGKENAHVFVLQKDFDRVLKEAGESTVVELLLEGTPHPVLIHDVQCDPLRDFVVHVDFYEVRMDEKVQTGVPISFTGEAPAVKAFGGILVKSLETIEVEALPADLPQHILVDLSGLSELNQTLYVKDIPSILGVRFLADPDMAVVSVVEQSVEVEEVPVPAGEVPTEKEASTPLEEEHAPDQKKEQ